MIQTSKFTGIKTQYSQCFVLNTTLSVHNTKIGTDNNTRLYRLSPKSKVESLG
jgi:hypothetical protein